MSILARSSVGDTLFPFSLAALSIGQPLATFKFAISFAFSLLGPGSERPGKSIPSSSTVFGSFSNRTRVSVIQ